MAFTTQTGTDLVQRGAQAGEERREGRQGRVGKVGVPGAPSRSAPGTARVRNPVAMCRYYPHRMFEQVTSITIVRRPGEAVLAVSGDVDTNTSATLLEHARVAMTERRTHLMIDFAAVRFCDAAGLTALVMIKKWADAAGTRLSVVNIRGDVYRVFAITGMTGPLNASPAYSPDPQHRAQPVNGHQAQTTPKP